MVCDFSAFVCLLLDIGVLEDHGEPAGDLEDVGVDEDGRNVEFDAEEVVGVVGRGERQVLGVDGERFEQVLGPEDDAVGLIRVQVRDDE